VAARVGELVEEIDRAWDELIEAVERPDFRRAELIVRRIKSLEEEKRLEFRGLVVYGPPHGWFLWKELEEVL
jgi:hypothetical protein